MSTATIAMGRMPRVAEPAEVTVSPSRRGAAGPASRIRLTRRGRVVLTVAAAIPFVLGAVFATVSGGAATAGEHAASTHFSTVTVRTGDSLWSVAERVAPEDDPRAVVADLVSLNQLDGTVLTPGERLAVPARYSGTSR